jgi:hypothetical protein|tara:strand:- start:159 stop:518 length:360 start_codon:yes stop_codon:yes gene_type:complete
MQIIELTFSNELNQSLQVGDEVFYTPTTGISSFSTASLSSVVRLGEVVQIDRSTNKIQVMWDNVNVAAAGSSDFVFFVKNRVVNKAGLVGYYADVQFKNNSKKKIELFAVGSEIFESSK